MNDVTRVVRPDFDNELVTITESRPSEVLAKLHESARAEREYLFAGRDATTDDLVLVAWYNYEAVAYIAVTDQRADGLLIWEHLVAPEYRGRGLGERLLLEAVRRTLPGAIVQVDPLAELDTDRVSDYYQRLGFSRAQSDGRIWATALDVLRAAAVRTGSGLEVQTPIAELLDTKAPGVVTVDPCTSMREIISTMNTHRIGAIIVSTDGSRVEGIISERDVLVGFDYDQADFLDRLAGEVVTTDVLTCTSHEPISEVMERMTRERVRHMPVTKTGRLIGIVSIGDIVNFRLGQLEEPGQTDETA